VAKQLVLGIFANLEAAEAAVEKLRSGASDYSEMHLGPIGILVVDDDGQLKEHRLGQRSGGRGATIGLALAAVTPLGLGALIGGAAIGHFRQQAPRFSAEDRERLAAQLQGGKAALGVIVQAAQADLMTDVMTSLGGKPEAHDVTDEELEAAAAAAAATESAES